MPDVLVGIIRDYAIIDQKNLTHMLSHVCSIMTRTLEEACQDEILRGKGVTKYYRISTSIQDGGDINEVYSCQCELTLLYMIYQKYGAKFLLEILDRFKEGNRPAEWIFVDTIINECIQYVKTHFVRNVRLTTVPTAMCVPENISS